MYTIMLNIAEYFTGNPSQTAVAELFLRHGVSVRDGDPYVGEIKLADSAIARAAGVDRRVVRSAISRICTDPALSQLFSRLECIADFTGAAPLLGGSSIEVVPEDDGRPGTMARIMMAISRDGINVRQAIVSGGEGGTPSHLIIAVDGHLGGDTVEAIRACDGVSKVIIR